MTDPIPTALTEAVRAVKHNFMVYRNGILADSLRKAGYPQRIIFGLQLPQLTEIARNLPSAIDRHAMGLWLWTDKDVRESRLLAPYLIEPEQTDESLARRLSDEIQTPEEADILAFRLLRRLPFAATLHDSLPETHPVRKALARFL